MKSLTLPKAIFFDWDGTLVDSYDLIFNAHTFARKKFGMSDMSSEDFRPYFGKPREFIYNDIYGNDGTAAQKHFEDFVSRNHQDYTTPTKGAHDLLRALQGLGVKMGVVSNKASNFIHEEVKHLEWKPFFECVLGSGEAEKDKPFADPIYLAIERSGPELNIDNIWYVGDTEIDMQCAMNAGCVSILITNGNTPPDSIKQYKPSLTVENCTSLQEFLLQCSEK